MENDLSERLIRLEVLTAERQERTDTQFAELKERLQKSEDNLYAMLKKHDEDQTVLINQILKDVSTIASEAARYKGMLGGVVVTVSAVWFVLSQIAAWLHIDLISLLANALKK